MSRAYDMKQIALKACPNDKDAAVEMFLDILEMDEEDFEYEFCRTPHQYMAD